MPDANSSAGPGARLRALGLELPSAPKPLGNYVEASQAGSLLFISGTLPISKGKLTITGRLGDGITIEQGREAARLAAMNTLAAVLEHVGDLDRVKKLVKLNIYLAATPQNASKAALVKKVSPLRLDARKAIDAFTAAAIAGAATDQAAAAQAAISLFVGGVGIMLDL